jgi:hypothetical protein
MTSFDAALYGRIGRRRTSGVKRPSINLEVGIT